ncbi:hypothetical protein JYU34_005744 [Plutella xylostella]|uniref:Uncharacterized protein n=1 Tax=Plutella xylostella TaxID=51655 RepID=A0ABQ7QU15_PLUXY|nr:hypothetical protein JYU34_005744 [Plutella xylostella]
MFYGRLPPDAKTVTFLEGARAAVGPYQAPSPPSLLGTPAKAPSSVHDLCFEYLKEARSRDLITE